MKPPGGFRFEYETASGFKKNVLKLEMHMLLTTKINLPAQKSQVTEIEDKTCSVF